MERRLSLRAWSLSLLMPLAWGCDATPSRKAPRTAESVHVVVVAEARDDPTWAMWEAAARRIEQQDRAVKVDLLAPPAQSPREQQSLIQALCGQQLDAACIAPTDAAAVRRAIDELAKTGVFVVTVGRDVAGSNRAVYCGPAEMEMGRAAARACAAALEGRATKTVLLLHAGQDDPIFGPRYLGFNQEIRQFREVTLLREVDCSRNRSDAVSLVRLESRKYPRTGCWVFLEDWPLRAAGAEERLVPTDCRVVLCNGSPRYFAALQDGRISALVTYDYAKSAYEAISVAASLARDNAAVVTQHRGVDVEIVTASDLADLERRWKSD
jgi:ABC-type sugar transport system substrate-binding protein